MRFCSDRQDIQARGGPRNKALVTGGERFGAVSEAVSCQGLASESCGGGDGDLVSKS